MYVSLSPFDRKKISSLVIFLFFFFFSNTGITYQDLSNTSKLETGIKGQQETQIYFLLFRPTAQVSSPIVGGFKFACPCRRWCCCVLQVLIDVNLVPWTAIAAAALTAAVPRTGLWRRQVRQRQCGGSWGPEAAVCASAVATAAGAQQRREPRRRRRRRRRCSA